MGFPNVGRPGTFETFAGAFLRRVNAEFAADGDFGCVFENVAALDQLPATGVYVVAPMKIKDGRVGPLCVIAWVARETANALSVLMRAVPVSAPGCGARRQ